MTKSDSLNYLEWQIDCGEKLAEASAAVPAQWLLLDRDAAEARRRPPKLFLLWQLLRPFIGLCYLWRRNEVALC